MRIGFDGKRAVQNFTGLGNYSRYIVDILCQFYPENEYVLYAPKKRENKRLDKLTKQYQQLQLSYPTTSSWKKLSSLWRVWGVTQQLEKEKIDIFHGLSNELPLNIHQSEVKSIVTIHDLIFLRYPQYYHSIDRKIYTYKFRKACENADKIIAISECTKRDIIEYFRIPADKIEVVYQGCDPSFIHPVAAEKKREIRAKYQLPDHYILNVGSIEERKNALSAVQALTMLPEQIHLVIVGRHTEYTDKIERFIKENKLEERVHIISNVPFDDLPAFYQLAEIFVYPSRFEGFGLVLAEAMSCGIPCVSFDCPHGPSDIIKDYEDGLLVEKENIKELADKICYLIENENVRIKMGHKARENVKRFLPENVMPQWKNLFESLTYSSK